MYKKIILILMMIMLVVSGGCGKKESNGKNSSTAAPSGVFSRYESKNVVNNTENSVYADQLAAIDEKKIIQNFQISITVDDVKNAAKEIGNKAKEFGGFTETEELMDYSSNSSIRIPSQKVDLFVEYLEKNYDVSSKNKNIEDITDVYVDNDARLKNLKAEESQILEVLKKANTVDEILKVQAELYSVRGEIEVLEAKKKTWDKQVDYSTVKINIVKKQIISDKKIKVLNSNEFFSSSWKGFKNTFLYLVLTFQTIIIFLFSNLIPITILGGIVYGSYRIKRKKK